MMRHASIQKAALAGLLFASGVIPVASANAAAASYCPDGGTIRFGVEPYEAPDILLPAYRRIGQLMSEKLNCNVKIEITSSYTAEIEAMRHGKLDAGEFGPFGVVLAEKVAGAQTVAQFGDADGKPLTYWASIVTWERSGIGKLAGVEGKTFAYSDPASTSGHLMPAYALKQAGINPKKGVHAIYAGTHTNSFEALRNHKVNAGELNSETKRLAKNKGWLKNTDFKTLWKSKPLPLDAIALSPKLPKPLQQRLKKVLQNLSFSSQIGASGRKVMGEKSRLVPADNDTYAYIKQVMKKMHITIEDL